MRALARSATLLASASALSLPPRHLHHRHVAARAEAAGGVEGLTEPEEYVSTPLAGEFPASLRGTLFRLGPGAAPAPPVLARLRDRHAATPPRSRAPRRRRGAMPKARRSRRAPTPRSERTPRSLSRSERTPRSLSRSERTLAGAAPRRGEARGAAASYGLACAVTFDGGGGAVARARYVRTEASLNRAGNDFELPFLRKRTAPACQRRESHRTRRSSRRARSTGTCATAGASPRAPRARSATSARARSGGRTSSSRCRTAASRARPARKKAVRQISRGGRGDAAAAVVDMFRVDEEPIRSRGEEGVDRADGTRP